MFRPAVERDIPEIAAIYEEIHAEEAAGRMTMGWIRGVYPTRRTAEAALRQGDLFVEEDSGRITAAARINREQVAEYAHAAWSWAAPRDQVMVLHTLVVSPQVKGQGCGTRFVAFYERYALEHGCRYLRMDTNARNLAARTLYRKLGYREASIVPCVFNGIPDVQLVCLEKRL